MGSPCYSESTANTSTRSASWPPVFWPPSGCMLHCRHVSCLLWFHLWSACFLSYECFTTAPHDSSQSASSTLLNVPPAQQDFWLKIGQIILQREPPSNDVLPHFLLKVTSSAYQQESSTSFVQSHRRETALEGKDTDDDARGETDVLCVRALRGIGMQSHRGHLTCPSPARLCTSSGQQRPPRPGSRAPSSLLQCSCSPSISTASRSWLLYVSPAWLTPLALVGSPHGLCQGFSLSSLPCWPTWWQPTPLPGYYALRCAASSVLSIRLWEWAIITFVARGGSFLDIIHDSPTSCSTFMHQIWAI